MTDAPFLILASGSPRRRDLLTEAGYRFQVENPGIEENEDTSLPIRQLTAENARDKAAAVSDRFPEAIVSQGLLAHRILAKVSLCLSIYQSICTREPCTRRTYLP